MLPWNLGQTGSKSELFSRLVVFGEKPVSTHVYLDRIGDRVGLGVDEFQLLGLGSPE